MNRLITALALAAAVAGIAIAGSAIADDKPATTLPAAAKADVFKYKMKDIDGKEVDLSQYAGKVILMVNVASKCGNTPQYEALEKIYAKYKDKGFVIMGFPANNFGSQEPGTDAEIKEFCTSTYDVKFPMFSKISVKGADMHPLYKYLTALDTKPVAKGDISWNFEKFLVGRDGKVIARFMPKTVPEDPSVVTAVESALAAK